MKAMISLDGSWWSRISSGLTVIPLRCWNCRASWPPGRLSGKIPE